MPGTALDSVQNPLYIPLNDKGFPFLYDQSACGSPAIGRALTQRAKARPISNLATHLQAKVYADLTGSLRQPVRQSSIEVRLFNALFGSESEKVSGKNLPRTPFVVWTNRMSMEVKLLDNDHRDWRYLSANCTTELSPDGLSRRLSAYLKSWSGKSAFTLPMKSSSSPKPLTPTRRFICTSMTI